MCVDTRLGLKEGVLYTHCALALLRALQTPWLQTIPTATSNLATCEDLEGEPLCSPLSPETIAMDVCSENHREGIITVFSKEETEAHRGEGAPLPPWAAEASRDSGLQAPSFGWLPPTMPLPPHPTHVPRSSTFLTVGDQQDPAETALAQGSYLLIELVYLGSDQGLGTQCHHVFQCQGSLLALPQLLCCEAPQVLVSSVLSSPHLQLLLI